MEKRTLFGTTVVVVVVVVVAREKRKIRTEKEASFLVLMLSPHSKHRSSQ